MKFQDSSFNDLKVTVGTKSVTHARTHPRSKSNMPHQLFQSWGHKNVYIIISAFHRVQRTMISVDNFFVLLRLLFFAVLLLYHVT